MGVDTCEAAALSTATTPAHILYFARSPPVPSLLIRKRVITVEPKVPLANERTFLAWMEWAIFLSGASIAFASVPSSDVDPVLSQILSVLLIPFAIGAILHAFNQYTRRSYMILHGESTDKFLDSKNPVFFSMALTLFLCYLFIGKIFTLIHR